MKNRKDYADLMLQRIHETKDDLKRQYFTPGQIQSFVLDDLLPRELAQEVYQAFPRKEDMTLRNDLWQRKHVSSQMNRHNPVLEEITYAFQDPRILSLVSEITRIPDLHADENLYAGGISLMAPGDFLNPHIDNSHNYNGDRYRVLNLLYYVSPDWTLENGGNLELWDRGIKQPQRTVLSKFNRLVVMCTYRTSWHSVSQVKCPSNRCCVSNYFFSPSSIEKKDYYHVTFFRGRPEQKMMDFYFLLEFSIKNIAGKMIRAVTGKNVRNFHVYQKPKV